MKIILIISAIVLILAVLITMGVLLMAVLSSDDISFSMEDMKCNDPEPCEYCPECEHYCDCFKGGE